jgi:hypothetical protein
MVGTKFATRLVNAIGGGLHKIFHGGKSGMENAGHGLSIRSRAAWVFP